MSDDITVTVIVPARDEEADLGACLAAIARQTWPADDMEVLVVDGASDDATAAVGRRELAELGLHGRVLSNLAGGTSTGLNVGLAAARGRIVVRVDARARIGPDHVAHAVHLLDGRPEVGVVGGAQVASARGPGWRSQGIARALRNRWSTGLAAYRRADEAAATDTVWMGAFRTSDLRRLGGWDPAVGTNQDYELNERVRAAELLVWFLPEMAAGYAPRASLRALVLRYHAYGRAKGARWRAGAPVAGRHLVLLTTPPLLSVAGAALASIGGVPLVAAVSVVAIFMLDHLGAGAADRRASLPVRVQSTLVILLTDAAWWVGAVSGLVRVGWPGVPHARSARVP